MKYNCDNDILELFFTGRLTSQDAEKLSSEISGIIESNKFSQIVGNMKDLEYISSAGLRVILSILKRYPTFNLIEVNPEVYEVFDISGFSQMLPVKKALRKISTKDAILIGRGYYSEVYRIDNETIVKKYIRGTSLEDIERECTLAKRAFICGLPCAITYDVVRVDEAYGVVFEAMNAGTLLAELKEDESKIDKVVEENTAIFKMMHKTTGDRDIFPDAAENWFNRLAYVRDELTSEEYEKMSCMLKNLKVTDNFIHSDCHIGNIMRNGDEYMLIDMDTLSIGNPVFEFAQIFSTYVVFNEFDPNNSQEFFGIPMQTALDVFYKTTQKYFEGTGEAEYAKNLDKIKVLGYFFQIFWVKKYTPDNIDFLNFSHKKFGEYIEKTDDLNLVFADNQ